MREIKFRAWDGKYNEMIYLENSGLQYFDFEGGYSLGFTVDGYKDFWAHERYESTTKQASEFPIMQYTGLKDKNGVEIYDGDVVEFRANYTSKPCGYMKAEVVIGIYKLELHAENGEVYDAEEETDEFPYAHCEVIGNIYENPELLNN